MGYWQRKFHLKYTLPDGNIYNGFINTEADRREDLYRAYEIRGWFWARKEPAGWHGLFHLAPGLIRDKREKGYRVAPYLITTGVKRPERKAKTVASREEAEEILRYLEDVKYDEIPHFYGRLEDCIVDAETHHWE